MSPVLAPVALRYNRTCSRYILICLSLRFTSLFQSTSTAMRPSSSKAKASAMADVMDISRRSAVAAIVLVLGNLYAEHGKAHDLGASQGTDNHLQHCGAGYPDPQRLRGIFEEPASPMSSAASNPQRAPIIPRFSRNDYAASACAGSGLVSKPDRKRLLAGVNSLSGFLGLLIAVEHGRRQFVFYLLRVVVPARAGLPGESEVGLRRWPLPPEARLSRPVSCGRVRQAKSAFARTARYGTRAAIQRRCRSGSSSSCSRARSAWAAAAGPARGSAPRTKAVPAQDIEFLDGLGGMASSYSVPCVAQLLH